MIVCNYKFVIIGYIMIFEWDENKNISNQRKHGISFEMASRVFLDPFLQTYEDVYNDELRWLSIGSVDGMAVLLVVHTYRDEDGEEVVRIISARKLSKSEVKKYGYR